MFWTSFKIRWTNIRGINPWQKNGHTIWLYVLKKCGMKKIDTEINSCEGFFRLAFANIGMKNFHILLTPIVEKKYPRKVKYKFNRQRKIKSSIKRIKNKLWLPTNRSRWPPPPVKKSVTKSTNIPTHLSTLPRRLTRLNNSTQLARPIIQ